MANYKNTAIENRNSFLKNKQIHLKALDCKSVSTSEPTSTSESSIDLSNTNSLLINIAEQLNELTNITDTLLKATTQSNVINWYDNSSTITNAVTSKPSTFDSSDYTSIKLWTLLERNSPKLTIYNDGPGTLYIIISHASNQYTEEFPLYEGEAKTYIDVREIKLRAPIIGCTYRLTEFQLWKQKNVDYKSGRGYLRNSTVAIGNADPATAYTTANTHNVFSSMYRNATTGYIKNRDSVGQLFCWISIDGTEYGQVPNGQGLGIEYFTVDPNSAINLDGWDIYSVKVSSNQNNINYEIALG